MFWGYSVLIYIIFVDGSYLLLGVQFYCVSGISNGLVGLGGEVYVSGVDLGEKLQMKWGEMYQ